MFTWTAMVTIVAGELKDWEAYEPITLPRYNLLIKADQDRAMRVLEEHAIDFTMVAWPCTPWSIMQNMNQKPWQIRNLKLTQEEHRVLLMFVE